MKNFMGITISKIKSFRLNKLCAVMVVLATIRTVMAGESIWLTGVCAAVLPFMCQARRWPAAPKGTPKIVDSLTTYVANLFYMAVYLGVICLLAVAANAWVPIYEPDAYFLQKFALVVSGGLVFVSTLCFICSSLDMGGRMLAGVIMSNGLLGFSFVAAMAVDAGLLDGCIPFTLGFDAIVVIMTLTMAFMGEKIAAKGAAAAKADKGGEVAKAAKPKASAAGVPSKSAA